MCGMWTIHPRAERIAIPIPILYRRPGDDDWMNAKVVNLSQSGVLFGPTGLEPGSQVEVMLSPPALVGALATGKQVCLGAVVRVTDVGTAAARFDECRFILES
jgi:PilZ domain